MQVPTDCVPFDTTPDSDDDDSPEQGVEDDDDSPEQGVEDDDEHQNDGAQEEEEEDDPQADATADETHDDGEDGTDEEDECEVNHNLSYQTLRDNLQDELAIIQRFGSFAVFGGVDKVTPFVDPLLSIGEGLPPVQLPLQEVDARRLIAASHQAPFGRGSETLLDLSVRRTWELNSDQFSIVNPRFHGMVNQLLSKKILTALDVPQGTSVTAQPYKMLLYERGAMFKPHVDSEKADGMFATLVICLPSAHEGGDVVLTHKGEAKRFSSSLIQPSYACWYADVNHEVKEVASGYRLVLTYNIIQTQTAMSLSASKIGIRYPDLRQALTDWAGTCDDEVVYILEHKYTDASLKLSSMKGADISRMRALMYFADKCGYDVFLASMEHERHGESDETEGPYDHYRDYDSDTYSETDEKELYPIYEVIDQSTTLTRIVAPDGTELLTGVQISEEALLEEDVFEMSWRSPHEHAYQGFTGNAGAQSTHWYRDTVVVLVPSNATMSWLLDPFEDSMNHYMRRDVTPLLAWLSTRQVSTNSAKATSDLVQLCEFIIKKNIQFVNGLQNERYTAGGRARDPPFSAEVVSTVIECLTRLKRYRSLASAVACANGALSSKAFEVLSPVMTSNFAEVENALTQAFINFAGLDETYQALKALFGGNLNSCSDAAAKWASRLLRHSAFKVRDPSDRDGKALVEVAVFLKDPAFLLAAVGGPLTSHVSKTGLVLAFLAALVTKGQDFFDAAVILKCVRVLAIPALARFSLEVGDPLADKRLKTADGHSRANAAPSTTPIDIADVLNYFLDKQLHTEARELLLVLENIVLAGKTEITRLLIPFLRHAQVIARANSTNDSYGPLLRSLYRKVLEAHIQHYVKTQPPAFENWTRARVHCNCHDCWQLNLFLISPAQDQLGFPVGKSRRAHLHQVVESSRADCSHVTDRRTDMLVVKKRARNKVAYDAWFARCKEVAEELQRFDPAVLRDMLGRRYEEIMEMRSVISDRHNIPAAVGIPPPTHVANAPVRAGTKRKAEVIDLCDSSD